MTTSCSHVIAEFEISNVRLTLHNSYEKIFLSEAGAVEL